MIASALLEVVVVICGLIVPSLWIKNFGSGAYGTMSSINSIMGIIALGDAGVGSVIRVAMYKPLAEHDSEKLSSVWRVGKKYFNKLALFFLFFIAAVSIYYGNKDGSEIPSFVALELCLVIGFEYFIQYFFGYINILVLNADQRLYILNFVKSISTILNLIVIFILTQLSLPLIYVKAASILVYAMPPMVVYFYVNKRYGINKKALPDQTALKQKWYGLALHFSYYIQQNTDVLVLTFFADALSVAVYAIYNFITSSLVKLISILYSSIDSAFGNMIAKGEMDNLKKKFEIMQFFTFFIVIIFYTVAAMLIVPFVKIYTAEFDMSAAYIQPVFGYLLLTASALKMIRTPFQYLISAAGKFKETMYISIVESIINVVLSIILVYSFGLVGVAIGTAVSILYTTINYAWFLKKNIIQYNFFKYIKLMVLSVCELLLSVFLLKMLKYETIGGYGMWIVYGIITFVIVFAICTLISFVFARKEFSGMCRYFLDLIKRFSVRKKRG